MPLLSALLSIAPLSLAAEDDLDLRYTLSVAGQPVGWREVSLSYRPHPDGERHQLQTYTELTIGPDTWKIRASGLSTPRSASFSCTVDHNGRLEQIQGVLMPDGGWQVTRTDGRTVQRSVYPRAEARLSSLDLHDPARSWRLDGAGPVGLLLVESGQILSGTMGEAADATINLGPVPVPTRRYTAADGSGTATFDLDVNNVLIRSEVAWLGVRLVSTLEEPPPLRVIQQIEAIEAPAIKVQDL